MLHSNSQKCSHLQDQKLQEPFNFLTEGDENQEKLISLELLTLALELNMETEKNQYKMQGQKLTLTACYHLLKSPKHT